LFDTTINTAIIQHVAGSPPYLTVERLPGSSIYHTFHVPTV